MFARVIKRSLGTATRGPKLRDVGANIEHAVAFFTKPSLSYSEFHQRCTSLRLFVFWGVVLGLTTDLIITPPRSSYWQEWNFWRWPGNFISLFTRPANHIFLGPQTERSIDVPQSFAFLVANRRMPDDDVASVYARREAEMNGGHH